VSSEDDILCSVVIPVKNGIETLPECLEGIRKQSIYPSIEIIIIDSGSTDGTLVFLQSQHDVLLKEISPQSFNHGTTRNLGVLIARGKLVAMTVQDAIPVDHLWLEKMIHHFDDQNVAGVCGQQVVPHDINKNPHQWFRPVNSPTQRKIKFGSSFEYDRLSPEQKKNVCNWDNVNAMYRRDILLKIPFREAFFAEDSIWAQDAFRQGYTLVYDNSAQVYHYHYQTYEYTYKRMLTQLYFGYKIFTHKRINRFNSIEYIRIIYRNIKYRVHPKWIWHNWRIIHARNKSFKDFYYWLRKGEGALDDFYNLICKSPPQGKAKKDV